MSENHQEDLKHIRSMMERSSTFISLSGWSGVFAGVFALAGAFYTYTRYYVPVGLRFKYIENWNHVYIELIFVAAVVLILSVAAGILLTIRKSKKNNLPIWTSTTRKLLLNLSIPLVAGGIFCIALLYHGSFLNVAPATLVFYGLALVSASKYTYGDIKYLGLCEIGLGLVAMFALGYGLFFWALGFGVLHIVYGVIMAKKYQ